jgi:SSS family solute:Na+ symporter
MVVAVYVVCLLVLAQWVSREKSGHQKDTKDYFLAGRSLPWWAIGASLIAANISAEQIIGMSGSAYVLGIAIASYEWMSALTLIIVGKYLLPVFLKHEIYTMPQFLEKRYDGRVRTVLATFWIGVYVFVNLTAILWLGSLAIHTVTGLEITYALCLLGAFSAAYSLYGGLKAVALTDIIQVVLLILGGLMIAYVSLDKISDGAGVVSGFAILLDQIPEKFDMILSKDSPHYANLPGISVLIGGMWVMNLSYWGFNQYIIQRALAAKDNREAQKGIVFAAFLKMLIPVLVVLPGIAAVVLAPDLPTPDSAYPEVMKLLPVGIKGLVFAALIAAIVSSLASMTNSISTIFTMDVYANFAGSKKSETHLVTVGRLVSFSSLVIAMIVSRPLLGNFDQAFQYIQEFTGFFTPGIVAIFLLAIFWKPTTANGALGAAVGSAVLSLGFKLFWPALPFIDRVGLAFLLCVGLGMLISKLEGAGEQPGAIKFEEVDCSTSTSFNFASLVIVLMLIALYATWW